MVKINGRTFNQGDFVTFNKNAEVVCHAPAGLMVVIHRIKESLIGLYSPDKRIDDWGNLDGEVGDYRGWWISREELSMCITESAKDMEITQKFEYKGIDLKGKTCRILAHLQDGTVFVEFKEDVNGCSADGLGKTGHCVALNPSILTTKKERKEKYAK